jgi:hypothetical protein
MGSAFYNTYTKKLLETLNPVESLVYSFLVTDVELAEFILVFESPRMVAFASLGLSVCASLLVIAIFSLSTSMLLYFWVIERIDVTQASLSIYLLPVFGVLLSTVFVREGITAQLVFGGCSFLPERFWLQFTKNANACGFLRRRLSTSLDLRMAYLMENQIEAANKALRHTISINDTDNIAAAAHLQLSRISGRPGRAEEAGSISRDSSNCRKAMKPQ